MSNWVFFREIFLFFNYENLVLNICCDSASVCEKHVSNILTEFSPKSNLKCLQKSYICNLWLC